MNRIVSILPKGEGFCSQQFGAIALCVRDFTEHSRYRGKITILGGTSASGFDGIDYKALPGARWWQNRTRSYAKQCVKFINANNITLAEVHNRPNILRFIVRHTHCKTALHLHNDPQEMDTALTPEERRTLLEACNGVYCVSNYIRDRFLEGLDASASHKVHLIYNGIEIPTSLPVKENHIVFAGRMTEGKGALLLAQALTIALPKLPHWRATLIGSRRHAATETLTTHEKEIINTLQSLGSQIEMPGFINHKETLDYFEHATIAVVPSVWQEPFGRTALEAMSQGCALISSGRGGLKEVTGDAALTIDALTAENIANAILFLATNPKECERLQVLGKKQAAAFSIAKCTKTLDDARDIILNGPNRHVA